MLVEVRACSSGRLECVKGPSLLPHEGVLAGVTVFAVNEDEFAITVDVCVSAAAEPNFEEVKCVPSCANSRVLRLCEVWIRLEVS